MVIGLDGATWNIIKPLVDGTKLPTIRKIMDEGIHGNLESSIPAVTFPAWKCYSTGKNPGKLGVYWWMHPDFEKKCTKMNISTSFKSKEIWDHLNDYGITCGVIGMPTTFPPKKINEFMVSEFNPSNEGYTNPKELETELSDKINFTGQFSDYHGKDKDLVIKDCTTMMKQRFEATAYLYKKYKPMFLHSTIFHIDNIQHFYWKYMNKDDSKYSKTIENAWDMIDKGINDLLNETQPEYVILMSDHGFTTMKSMFNINYWLMNKGYLVLESKLLATTHKFGLMTIFIQMAKKALNAKEKIFSQKSEKNMEDAYGNLINWNLNKVFPLPGGLLYINHSKFPTTEEYDEFRDKLIVELGEITNPQTNEKFADKIYKKEELYEGDYMDSAPDVVILPNKGYEIITSFSTKLWDFSPKEDGWSGVHKLHGIFLAHGPDIKQNATIEGARIIDLAPTILHMYGVPIPRDMDGRVLTEIFNEDSEMAQRKVVYEEKKTKKDKERGQIENKIMRLKNMGKT